MCDHWNGLPSLTPGSAKAEPISRSPSYAPTTRPPTRVQTSSIMTGTESSMLS
jgi:hypothetical protein